MKLFSDGLQLRRWGRLCLRLIAVAVMGAMLCSAVAEDAQVSGLNQEISEMPKTDDVLLESAAVEPGVHLYAIVSDMRGTETTVLSEHRLFYEMALMSVAIELQESGLLRGISLCTTQTQANGFQEIAGEPGDVALQLYCAMEGMVSAKEDISANTWAAIERALDQSAEEGTRPVILLLYGDDIKKIKGGNDISEKANRLGAQIFYLQGERAIDFEGFEQTLGAMPVLLSESTEAPAEGEPAAEMEAPAEGEPAAETEAPAEGEPAAETEAPAEGESATKAAEIFYANCGTANALDSESLQKLVAALVQKVLGGEWSVSPFQLVPTYETCLSLEPQDRDKGVYSLFCKDLNPYVDLMLINLSGVEEVVKSAPSVRVDASIPGSTLFAVNLHTTQQAAEETAAQGDAAPEETAAQGDALSEQLAAPGDAEPEETATQGDALLEQLAAPGDAAPEQAAAQDDAAPEETAAQDDAAASDAANQTTDGEKPATEAPAGDAEQMPVALDEPVDNAEAESELPEGETKSQAAVEDVPVEPTAAPEEPEDPNFIATVRGDKLLGKGILLHESLAIRARMDAQDLLDSLQSVRLIWPEKGDNELKVDFSAVDAEQLKLLDGGEYRASAHVFRGEDVVVGAAYFNSSVASEPLAFTLNEPGAYHVRMVVEHGGVQVEGDVGEEFSKDNQKPQLVGDAEISLGTFVVTQSSDVLDTLDLAPHFSDADVGAELHYYLGDMLLDGSEWTIYAGEKLGDVSYSIKANDSIDYSEALTVSWTTRSAQELMASADFELSVTPEEIFKGTECEISATATLAEAEEIQNLDQLDAIWAATDLTAKFVGADAGSAQLPDVALASAGRGEDGSWLWKGSFTAPTAQSGDYEIELVCEELRLNEGELDELSVVNRAPRLKEGAQLEIDERPKGISQTMKKELKLADLIDAEPNDVLRIQIRSTGSTFLLDEETGVLEQQEGDGGGECGTMTWNVAEQPDRSLTISISHFNQLNRADGALKLDIEDQEGEACPVDISYNVENNRRAALILSVIAFVLAALVVLAIVLWGIYLIQKTKGLRFRLVLEDAWGSIDGVADTKQFKGNRISLNQLMLIARLPPQTFVSADLMEKIQIFAEAKVSRMGRFGVVVPENQLTRIEVMDGKPSRNGYSGCKSIVIHGDNPGDKITISVQSGKSSGSSR